MTAVAPPVERPAPPTVTETVSEDSFVPPMAAAEEPPQPAPTPATVPPQVVVPPTAHLLQLCLLGICLTVL